jgi:predicted 3-demethylubiquinone-9 3-methyltransferase (glyoxalase superfamily)
MTSLNPFLWFDSEAEQAAELYTSLFEDAEITDVSRYGEGGPGPAGTAMTVSFVLGGVPFVALNGGPSHQFTDAFSMQVHCDTQDEVDRLWGALTEGGEEGRCGWCKDRFGLSWQVVPKALGSLLQDPDPGRAQRAMTAMLAMSKLDVDALTAAADAA